MLDQDHAKLPQIDQITLELIDVRVKKLLNNEKERYFKWGRLIVTLLGLTTLTAIWAFVSGISSSVQSEISKNINMEIPKKVAETALTTATKSLDASIKTSKATEDASIALKRIQCDIELARQESEKARKELGLLQTEIEIAKRTKEAFDKLDTTALKKTLTTVNQYLSENKQAQTLADLKQQADMDHAKVDMLVTNAGVATAIKNDVDLLKRIVDTSNSSIVVKQVRAEAIDVSGDMSSNRVFARESQFSKSLMIGGGGIGIYLSKEVNTPENPQDDSVALSVGFGGRNNLDPMKWWGIPSLFYRVKADKSEPERVGF